MIKVVDSEKMEFHSLPKKLEAGTAPIEGAIGLGKAIDYLNQIGLDTIQEYEERLNSYVVEQLGNLSGITLYGEASHRSPIFSLSMRNAHPHDLGTFLDSCGISVRVGHHCAQLLTKKFQVPATLRASFCFYNTFEEADLFIESLKKAGGFFNV